jgi:glycosyltransferase involved in cell wall biosynthesis
MSRLVVISQVYVPDPASVGQHLHDVAAEMARRGFQVRVFTASRGYDSPAAKYPPRETIDGVDVIRLPLSSLGKKSLLVRLVGQLSFLVQAALRGLFTAQLRCVLVSTAPPMATLAGLALAALRRVPMVFWVMDINPDEAIALGAVRPRSLLVRLFDLLNRVALAAARRVVTLDRFMAARLLSKRDVSGKLAVFPPWPHQGHLDPVSHEHNPFRRTHGLDGKFVVMYSGNHSPVNPISTALEAAGRLRHRPDILFLFVGGGIGKKQVDQAVAGGAGNIVALPYQPLAGLKYSLSAADVHLVTLGRQGVGIVHPCKVYGAMAVGRPVLAVCPQPSHISDLLCRCDFGRQVEHGDVDGAVRAILELAEMSGSQRAAMGLRGRQLVERQLSKRLLCAQFGDILAAAMAAPAAPAAGPALPRPAPAETRTGTVERADRRKAA